MSVHSQTVSYTHLVMVTVPFAAGGSVAIAILKGTSQAEILGTITADGTVTITAENSITCLLYTSRCV